MKCYIAKLPFGIVALDENLKIISLHKFTSPEKAAWFFISEDKELIEKLENEVKNKKYEICEIDRETSKKIREVERNIGIEIFGNVKALNEFLNAFAIELAKLKISSVPRRDKLIIQVASAIADLDKILNLMSERLREWYGLHFPELEIENHEKFAKTIAEKGKRENFGDFEFSIGMDFEEDDEKNVKLFAQRVYELYGLRDTLDKYLEKMVKREMPNLYTLLGHVLAARLLAAAGSLEKLAKMPASTIQLLGAEKALFRFLRSKGKTKPPKHGIIFLSPYVAKAPKNKRGKIARLLAAKLAMAARMDYYTKENKGEELKKELEKKIKEVLEGK